MKDVLELTLLDNRIRDYLIVAGIILLAYAMRKYVGQYFARLLFFLFRQVGWRIDEQVFTKLILGPADNFIILLISYLALSELKFPEAFRHSFLRTDTQSALQSFGMAMVILFFFRMMLRVIDYVALVMEKKADQTPDQDDNQLIVFFKDFLKVLLMLAGFLTMLRFAFEQDITKILAGLSLAGAAIALAARESLENLIASFIIFFDKPFSTGDVLKVNNITGTVERVGLRSTRIRTADKTYVTVPNKQMVDSIVDNLSLRSQRRAELRLELDPGTDSARLRSLLEGLKEIFGISGINQSSVLLTDITPVSFHVQCEYFTEGQTIEEFNLFRHDLNLKVVQLLETLDVSVAGFDKERWPGKKS